MDRERGLERPTARIFDGASEWVAERGGTVWRLYGLRDLRRTIEPHDGYGYER